MNTEKLAVNAVERIIAKCPRLDPVLASNDTVPFTDGHIDRYESPKHTRANHLGRIPVQVKGRKVPAGKSAPPTFSLTRADLNGYLNERGVLLFYVAVDEETLECDVYFAVLNPLKIASLMASTTDESENIPFTLEPLPEDTREIEGLLRFVQQTRREDPENTIGPDSWGSASELTLSLPGPISLTEPTHLKPGHHDYSLMLTTAEGFRGFTMVELNLVPESYLPHRSALTLASGEVSFEHPVQQQIDAETVAIRLSDSFSFRLSDPRSEGIKGDIKLDMDKSLNQRIRDVGFFLNWIDNGGITINGEFRSLAINSDGTEQELRQHFSHLQRLAELFDFIGAESELIDLTEITVNRHNQLHDLHPALLNGAEVTPSNPTELGRLTQPVGPWHIELLVFEGSEPGNLRVQHLFDPDLGQQFLGQEDYPEGPKYFPVTPYELVEPEKFSSALNLGLDRIVDFYSPISKYDTTRTKATFTVLNLINAADETPSRKDKLLDGADDLNQWLIAEYGEEDAYFVNRLQIKTRRGREFSFSELRQLRNRRSAARVDGRPLAELVVLSCTILLRENEEADYCFEQLAPEDQETVRTWPIWSLQTVLSSSLDH